MAKYFKSRRKAPHFSLVEYACYWQLKYLLLQKVFSFMPGCLVEMQLRENDCQERKVQLISSLMATHCSEMF